MTRNENDRESTKKPANIGAEDDKSSQNDKSEDWIAEMERELQEISKKWPGSGGPR